MANETDVATAALAIAISALVIAAGQLISQLFSTADGYRRCQPSVIGDWYKLVELPFRWSSFRYEVRVTTPHFQIATMSDCEHRASFLLDDEKPLPNFPWSLLRQKSQYLVPPRTPVALIGTRGSRLGTFCKFAGLGELAGMSTGEDIPTWANLLQDLQDVQALVTSRSKDLPIKQWPNDLSLMCISRKTRSWDFMPPDIVRPIASTTIGCLITMVHRLGMTWTDFQLDEGKMRAIGGGRSFYTSIVCGMGLVVEHSTIESNDAWEIVGRIPSEAADMMACGIIPITTNISGLRLRDRQTPAVPSLSDSISALGLRGDVKATLRASLHNDPAHRLPEFTDIVSLLASAF